MSEENQPIDVTAFSVSVDSSNSYVAQDGYTIYVALSGVTSLPLQLPAHDDNLDDVNGFYVYINGVLATVKTATIASQDGSSVLQSTIILKIFVKINKNDSVIVKYFSGNLTQYDTTSIASFTTGVLTNKTSLGDLIFFDPLEWNSSFGNSNVNIGTGNNFFSDSTELFKKEFTYPYAEVILDTTPPEGLIIINESANTGGVDVRTFAAYKPADTSTSGYSDRILPLLTSTVEAWQYLSSAEQTVKSFVFRMKYIQDGQSNPAIGNAYGRVTVYLYSNTTGDIPNTSIKEIGFIQYDSLTSSYKDFTLTPATPITLASQTTYWFVLSFETIIKSGVTSAGKISMPVKSSTSLFYAVFENSVWRRFATKQIGFVQLEGSFSEGESLASSIMAQDIIGKNLYEATNFGGTFNPSRYEKIGNGQAYYLNMYLTPTNNVYPSVNAIDVGVTASNQKSYYVEVKTSPDSQWQVLYENVADSTTIDFLRYKFDTPLTLSNIRIVYKGDYTTLQENGTLTVGGIDRWSDVVEIQASHFSDFRDADDFINVNGRGWAPFTEGVSVYDWSIVNNSRLWSKFTNTNSLSFLHSEPASGQVVSASRHNVSVSQAGVLRNSANGNWLNNGDSITAMTVHNSIIYIGTENGYLYQSKGGDYWSLINSKNPLDSTQYNTLQPITALASYGGALYIGTKAIDSTEASLIKYENRKFITITTFNQNKISCMVAHLSRLFIGVAGLSGEGLGSIYFYDGTDIKLSLTTDFDEVQAISYSSAFDTVVAGFKGGEIWKLVYDSSDVPSTWSKITDVQSSLIYNINDDTSGNYLFIATDNGMNAYVKASDEYKIITNPKYSNQGGRVIWKTFGIGTTDYQNDRDIVLTYENTRTSDLSNTNLSSIKMSGVGSSYYTFTLEGAIKAPKTTDYSFLLKSNAGVRLTVDDTQLTTSSNWLSTTNVTSTVSNVYSSNTVSLVKNEYYKLKLEVAVGTTSANPLITLQWKDNSLNTNLFENLDFTNVFKPNSITSIVNYVNAYVGSGLDGSTYYFSPEYYATNKKYAYVRLKDEAGNYHNYTMPDGSIPYASLDDYIYLGGTGTEIVPPPPGIGQIKFLPTSVKPGITAAATLFIPSIATETKVFTITTDASSTSDVGSVTIAPGSKSASFNVTVKSTVDATVTTTTAVTAILGTESYSGNLGINAGDITTDVTKGVIYQIKAAMDPAVSPITYVPSATDAIYAPKRKTRSLGNYVNRPFYVPTLTQWTSMDVLILNKYDVNTALGLDAGTEVNVYVRTADSAAACLQAKWSSAFSKSYINNSTVPATAETLNIDLTAYSGKFIQYYLELSSATKNLSPEVLAVTITYQASTGSYFFTKTFDTTDYSTTLPAPEIRRGLITSNQDKKDGNIVYGYTTDDRDGYKYDFSSYTVIEPNKTFELDTPSSTIKFAIMLTSIDGDPSIVYDFAVQLDAGDEDLNFMPEP